MWRWPIAEPGRPEGKYPNETLDPKRGFAPTSPRMSSLQTPRAIPLPHPAGPGARRRDRGQGVPGGAIRDVAQAVGKKPNPKQGLAVGGAASAPILAGMLFPGGFILMGIGILI